MNTGSPDFEAARRLFLQGLQQHQQGQLAQAEQSYRASLQQLPGRASTLGNLGAVLLQQGRPAEALPLLDESLAADPGQPDALGHRGMALAALGRDEEALATFDRARAGGDSVALQMHRCGCLARLGRLPEALAACERALALDGEFAEAWAQRGSLLVDLGRHGEAAQALRRALALGADPAVNGWLLAALSGEAPPPAAPAAYVATLFDGYAASFEQHLAQGLGYRVPGLLAAQLQRLAPPPGALLDLGCGTGLVAQALGSTTIDGVDLSAHMLAQARAGGRYRQLWQAELAAHLQATPERYAVVLAADVFIYLGELAPVFAGVRRVLQPGGLFCFSVEQAPAATAFELRPSMRYAHGEAPLRQLAAQQGFQVIEALPITVRHEQRQPVDGLLFALRAA
jgi:predicted TPR repeat methyltransferase